MKPEVSATDEVTFADFEKAYSRMGDDFANVIALEEVKEIFEHFKVKRTASGRSINEDPGANTYRSPLGAEASTSKTANAPKEKAAKSLAPSTAKSGAMGGGIQGVASSKMRLKEFIKTVSQDDS